MKYYLGENFSKSYYQRVLIETGGTGHTLASFASASTTKRALEWLAAFPPTMEFMIDSGAFTIWNTGGSVDREELLAFYQAIKTHFPNAHFINLDSIPGKRGQKPNAAEVKRACEESWDNYMWFKSKGFEVLPVFHEDDEWEYLHRMMKETDYIAISPANDSSTKRRIKWLDKVYTILKADYKTHGLAATSVQLLKRYPFYSVDSINWKAASIYGGKSSKAKGISVDNISALVRNTTARNVIMRREIEHYVALQDEITRLWAKRGVIWKD